MDEQLKNQLGILKTIKELEDKNIDKVLKSVQRDLDNAKNEDEANKEVKKQLSRDFDDIKWFKDNRKNCIAWIEKLYKAGDRLYSLSICDTLSNSIKILYEHQTEKVEVDKLKSCYDAIIIIGEILYKHDFKVIEANVDLPSIKMKKSNLHKLDGMDSLLVNLGDKKFIELAIAGSFFFDPRLVKKEIENLIKEFSVSENIRKKLSDVNLESSIDSGKAKNDVTDFVSEKISKIEKEQKDNLQKVNKLFNILTEKNFKEYLIKSKNLESDVNQQESKLEVYLANQFREEIKKVGESMPQDDEVFEYLKKTYNPTKKTIDGLKSSDKLNEYLAAKQLAKLDTFRDNQIEKMNYLKARYTIDGNIVGDNTTLKKGDKAVYTIEDPNSKEEIKFMVHIDRDGNRFVRNLITDKTGITVSQGKDSVLQNTIISHVWGRAYDPRYFTSLWNIVLVPAWANSLMDKEEAPAGTLASKMRATYMQLCTKLYNEYQESKESKKGVFPEKVEGNYLSGLPKVKNKEDIISGEFSFNVISESKKYIKIYTKNIEIEDQTTIKM